MVVYEERQLFPLWAYPVLFVGLAIPALLAFVLGGPRLPLLIGGIFILSVTVFIANLLYMRTTVTGKSLEVSFGYILTVYRKRFSLAEIQQEGLVSYRPILDAGGWGIRWGRFDSAPCRFLTARGRQGLLIRVPERFIIGSKNPDVLAHAIASSAESITQ